MRLAAIALLVGVGARVFLAVAFHGNWDQDSYEIVADIMRRGGNVYAETFRYNYSPLWAHVLLLLSYLAEWTCIPFHAVVRGFLTVIDSANAVLIGLIAARVNGWRWQSGFALYMLNPVSIIIVGYHGQFDTLAALPILLALWLAPRLRWLWLLCVASLVVKHILVFTVWTLLVLVARLSLRAVGLMAAAVGVLALTFAPYAADGWRGIIGNVLLYSSISGIYGLSTVLSPAAVLGMFIILMVYFPRLALRWNLSLERAALLSTLVFLTLTPGFGAQYCVLAIIFGTSVARPWLAVFSLVSTINLLMSTDHLPILPGAPIWNSIWLTVVGWLILELRALTRPSPRVATASQSAARPV